MIPKIIHYIWLGGKPLPKIAKKCINSWKKYCPDYEIKRWDESNLNLDSCQYVKQAYDAKKFAFASDYFRFEVLYKEGGIYLDIDVELLKPLDDLLQQSCFTGFEHNTIINPGLIFGSEKGNHDLKQIIDEYHQRQFLTKDGLNLTTVCTYCMNYYSKFGLKQEDKTQKLSNITVYATEYFCPLSIVDGKKRFAITKNSYSIHWYFGSWIDKKNKRKDKIKKFFNTISFGLAEKIYKKFFKRDKK